MLEASPASAAVEAEFKTIDIPPEDLYELVRLSAELRIRSEELTLARVRLDAAKAVSDAAAERVAAKMGVPKNAQEVTMDPNNGIIRFKMPASS